jgi:hypothetical protein
MDAGSRACTILLHSSHGHWSIDVGIKDTQLGVVCMMVHWGRGQTVGEQWSAQRAEAHELAKAGCKRLQLHIP